jgi:glycerol kinase
MLMHTGAQALASANGLITTSAAQPSAAREYALEGSVFIGGAVQWRAMAGIRAAARQVSPRACPMPAA